MKKLIPVILILAAAGAGGAWLYANRGEKEPTINLLQMSRGDIIDGVGATGTLQAVTTVTVGTQVSGIVQELYADFNSIVKKGQVVARLDPSILQTQVATAKANLENANANLERQRLVAEALGHPGEDAADVLASFIAELGMPQRLADVGVGPDRFALIATTAMHDKWLHTNPVRITSPEQILKILEAAA